MERNKSAIIERKVNGYKVMLRIGLTFGSAAGSLTTDLGTIGDCWKLTISADIFEHRNNRWHWMYGGQSLDDIERLGLLHDEILRDISPIWRRWHLNNMFAGTRAQNAMLEKCMSTQFEHRCECLRSNGLLVDRGYKYGSEWLIERLPNEVKREIKRIVKAAGEKLVG
jgi:hypothetical protein